VEIQIQSSGLEQSLIELVKTRSPAADQITGTAISVDGARAAQ
jgi:hypothetical protein